MSKELIISPVPADLLEYFWDDCIPILNRVMRLAPDELSLEITKANILRGNNRLIVILDGDKIVAVNVLDVIVFETGLRVMTIPITAGNRITEWAERFLNLCHIWARELDCTELRNMSMRPGWRKFLQQYGWCNHFMVMRCPVKEMEVPVVIPIKQGELT